MTIAARLKKDGSFSSYGDFNERLPVISDGLIAYYPLDNDTSQNMQNIPQTAKVLAFRNNTDSCPIYTWFNNNTNLTNCIDITSVTIEEAKQYDLVIADYAVWGLPNTVIDKLKTFVDAGVSCIATGNDTRTNVFVLEYNDNTSYHDSHNIEIVNNVGGLNKVIYTNVGSADLYGGITKLASNCIPYYNRGDQNTITGYFYKSKESGAVLFFDQECIEPTHDFYMSGMLFAYNNSKARTINTDTIKTTYGLSVQDATTNLITSVTKLSSFWGGLSGNTDYFIAPNGRQGISLTSIGSGGVLWVQTNSITATANTTYTISCKVKSSDYDSISQNLFYIREYNSTGQISETGRFIKTNKIKLDNDYYFVWSTFTTSTNLSNFLIQSYEYTSLSIQIYDLQCQRLSYPLEYVTSTTSASFLKIPTNVTSYPFTVSVKIINLLHDGQTGETGESDVAYPITWWTNSGGYKGVLGQISRTNDFFKKRDFRVTLICRNTDYSLYFDDILITTSNYYNNTSPGFNIPISLGSRNTEEFTGRFNGVYSDCSIYNRELSLNDIKNLLNNKMSVTLDNVIINKISESPVIINGIYYFPLSDNTNDFNNIIKPFKSENILFEDGSCYVGTSTTNLIPQNGVFTSYGSGTIPVIIKTPNLVVYSHDYKENLTWTYHGYSINITPGSTYTYSMDAFITKDFTYTDTSVFVGNCEGGFSASYNYNMSDLGKWKRFTNTGLSTGTVTNPHLYPNSDNTYSDKGKIYYKNWMLCNKIYRPCFCTGTSGNGHLSFNLKNEIGLNWSNDWSICYWKKPVATFNNDFNGYNIESLGCNGNSVGGGYIWWGKQNGSNEIAGSNSFNSSDYFNKWQFISLIKSGTSIIIKTILDNGTIYSTTTSTSNSIDNYYVTQYGYDFKLGGWDNENPTNTYFKDLIIAKKALTNDDINNIYKQLSINKINTYSHDIIENNI